MLESDLADMRDQIEKLRKYMEKLNYLPIIIESDLCYTLKKCIGKINASIMKRIADMKISSKEIDKDDITDNDLKTNEKLSLNLFNALEINTPIVIIVDNITKISKEDLNDLIYFLM